jgi:hypothetical protein
MGMILLSAVCRHRYTQHCNSVADPGCLSQISGLECFSVPDPESNKKEVGKKNMHKIENHLIRYLIQYRKRFEFIDKDFKNKPKKLLLSNPEI